MVYKAALGSCVRTNLRVIWHMVDPFAKKDKKSPIHCLNRKIFSKTHCKEIHYSGYLG